MSMILCFFSYVALTIFWAAFYTFTNLIALIEMGVNISEYLFIASLFVGVLTSLVMTTILIYGNKILLVLFLITNLFNLHVFALNIKADFQEQAPLIMVVAMIICLGQIFFANGYHKDIIV